MDAPNEWTADLRVLDTWIERAMGPGGTTTETAAAVGRAVWTAVSRYPDKVIGGVPNRVPGTITWWTADVDPERHRIVILGIEPQPRPGL